MTANVKLQDLAHSIEMNITGTLPSDKGFLEV
jgi:hypothetical protein